MPNITMDDLEQATQGFLRGQTTPESEGMRHSLPELAAALRMTRDKLQAIAETWSQAQLQTRPPAGAASDIGEDNWSATEALTHLMGTQNWYLLHLSKLLGVPRRFDVLPTGLGDLTDNDIAKDELASRLRAATEDLLATIAAIPASADLAATRDSRYFGQLSIRGWLFLALTHDTMHRAQIERLRTYPNFPAA